MPENHKSIKTLHTDLNRCKNVN